MDARQSRDQPCCSAADEVASTSGAEHRRDWQDRRTCWREGTTMQCTPRQSRALLASMLCSILAAMWLQPAGAVTPLSGWISGIATNYGGPADGKSPYDASWGTLDGSCGYGKLDKGNWPYWSVAALSSSNSFVNAGPINGCGQCFEVKCVDVAPFQGRCGPNQGSVIVQVTDLCPECEKDHLDIQALTYNKISPMSSGRISIQYRRVECVPPKPMVIFVDNNGGPGSWLRLFVEQAGGMAAVKQVQVRSSGGSGGFQSLNNKWGSDWEMPNAPTFPLDINIVGADGESVTAYQVIQNAGATGHMPTSVQFKIADAGDQSMTGSGSGGDVSSGGSSSGSPGPSTSGGSGGGSSCGSCTDVPPSSVFTCQQQKDWNACSQSWMAGFCERTCGKCTCSGGGGGGSGSPSSSPGGSWSPSPSSWSPSPSWSSSSSPSPGSWSPSPGSSGSNWSPSPSSSWSPSPSGGSWSPSPSSYWSPAPSSGGSSPSPSSNWSPSPTYASGGRKLLGASPPEEEGFGSDAEMTDTAEGGAALAS